MLFRWSKLEATNYTLFGGFRCPEEPRPDWQASLRLLRCVSERSAQRAPIPGDSRLERNLSTACVRYRIRAVLWSLGLSANGRLSWNFSRVFVLSIGGLMTVYAEF